ncbi:hypothetical protein RN001_002652 [Aquatica leii]|uniref:Uncharacterized protein n=1 Tax=Aquatica leii TaxID=1421715 RepID=A0AAN7SDF6_9COLE|nr:hypothetical protein RN001_002652 [Aquatica leii]
MISLQIKVYMNYYKICVDFTGFCLRSWRLLVQVLMRKLVILQLSQTTLRSQKFLVEVVVFLNLLMPNDNIIRDLLHLLLMVLQLTRTKNKRKTKKLITKTCVQNWGKWS